MGHTSKPSLIENIISSSISLPDDNMGTKLQSKEKKPQGRILQFHLVVSSICQFLFAVNIVFNHAHDDFFTRDGETSIMNLRRIVDGVGQGW